MRATQTHTPDVDTDPRAKELPQYSRRQVYAVWAVATIPMSVLAWIVAPLLSGVIDSRDPFIDSLLICFNVGLLLQLALVLILVRREQGSLAWARVRGALWLWAPRNPRTGRIGGRVWLWALLFIVLSGLVNLLPIDPTGPLPRDLPSAILTQRVADYFDGNLIGFAQLVVNALLSPIVEELVFRGLLLPRMRSAFGKADVPVNGLLFALYHLHQPWSMPAAFIDGTLTQAYPTRRFQSSWMGLLSHTSLSFIVIGVIAGMVF